MGVGIIALLRLVSGSFELKVVVVVLKSGMGCGSDGSDTPSPCSGSRPAVEHQGLSLLPTSFLKNKYTITYLPIRQITIMVPGQVRTPIAQKSTVLPLTPGYTADSPAAIGRAIIASSLDPHMKQGDLRRTMERVYELSGIADPPLRFVIGLDSLGAVRAHLERVRGEVDKFEGWSEGVKEE